MLSTEPTNSYAPQAAGKALMSVAWETRKQERRALAEKSRARSHWKRREGMDPNVKQATAKAATEIVEAMAKPFDAALDKFIQRVERLCMERGVEGVLEKIDALMPEKEPKSLTKSVGKS